MQLKDFTKRDVSSHYIFFDGEEKPQDSWQSFKRFVKRSLSGELFVGLWVVFREMIRFDTHTLQYPVEKIEMSPRYRAIHKLLRLFESGNERCIGCGLCEKICISKCIRMETYVDETSRKVVSQYSINFGRCIFCGYCAEVCPELAIVHGVEYENASEQRAHFGLKEDMLTPLDTFKAKQQKEFSGFGSLSENADNNVKPTPLAY